jgi:hypothetical protein
MGGKAQAALAAEGTTRAEMELAIRILFPDDADKMIDWLNRH